MRRRGAGQSGAATRVARMGSAMRRRSVAHRSLDGVRAGPWSPECPADLRRLGRVGELGTDHLGHEWELEDSVGSWIRPGNESRSLRAGLTMRRWSDKPLRAPSNRV